jgi:hypothetical protein
VLWRCVRGHEWETEARQRVKHATQCPLCLAGLWSSRLEFEVAELVSASTRYTVTVGTRLVRPERGPDERLDLIVEDVGLLVDLDPPRWHSDRAARARDARKLQRLAGRPYVRIRPAALGRLPSTSASHAQQVLFDGPHDAPDTWARAVNRALVAFAPGTSIVELPRQVRSEALTRVARRWRDLRALLPIRSLATEHPVVAAQFVGVVDRPGLTAADLAPAGDDRVLWRCSNCGHQWEARVANRTVLGTGCPPCSHRRGAARSATPKPGGSFATLHPELVAYFVSDETNPGKTVTELKPNSIDRCTWTCRYCGRRWVTTPHSLHRDPSRGCRPCGHRRGAEKRRADRLGPGSPERSSGVGQDDDQQRAGGGE